jgi:hypothetical protein
MPTGNDWQGKNGNFGRADFGAVNAPLLAGICTMMNLPPAARHCPTALARTPDASGERGGVEGMK